MRKIMIAVTIMLCSIFCIIFIKKDYKNLKKGNNMNNKSIEEIEQYILNISSYEAKAQVTIKSNKTTNTYIIKQSYAKDDNAYRQEVLEPENIKGVTFSYDGQNLKIENTKLNLSKIYNNYEYLGDNNLTLKSFIDDYSKSNKKSIYEENDTVILETEVLNGNKYQCYKTLYISKSTGLPTKLEVKDINKDTLVYILYNEIEINNLQKEDVLAFKLEGINEEI